VDVLDMVVGGLEKDRQDVIGEMDEIVVGGLMCKFPYKAF
jgi:hypothetical protein